MQILRMEIFLHLYIYDGGFLVRFYIPKAQRRLSDPRPSASAFGAFGTSWEKGSLVIALLSPEGDGLGDPEVWNGSRIGLVIFYFDKIIFIG